MPTESRMDRRQFAERLTLGTGAIAAAVASTSIAADDEPVAAKPQDPAKTKDEDKPQGDRKDEAAADRPAEPPMEFLLLTYLMRRYPSEHFDNDAVRGIYKDIRADVARGRMLNAFPLKNSDEPAFVFQAYRGVGF